MKPKLTKEEALEQIRRDLPTEADKCAPKPLRTPIFGHGSSKLKSYWQRRRENNDNPKK